MSLRWKNSVTTRWLFLYSRRKYFRVDVLGTFREVHLSNALALYSTNIIISRTTYPPVLTLLINENDVVIAKYELPSSTIIKILKKPNQDEFKFRDGNVVNIFIYS